MGQTSDEHHSDPVADASAAAEIVVGPLLRYVGTTTATVWVETERRDRGEVLGHRARTFRSRAITTRSCWSRTSSRQPSSVRGAARRRRVSGRRLTGGRIRRSARARASDRRDSSSAPAGSVHPNGLPTRSLRPIIRRGSVWTRSGRIRGGSRTATAQWPDGLLLLGRPGVRRRGAARDGGVHPRVGGTSASRPARRSPTSRSTRSCIASRGRIRTSAGCSRPCRRR